MSLNEALSRCAVIGAAGKMGRGIALLLIQELALSQPAAQIALVDRSPDGLENLKTYLHDHLSKFSVRKDLPESFADNALKQVAFETSLSAAVGCHLVFEAALEELDAKTSLFLELKKHCADDCYFLTNTSSLPIGILEEACELHGRIMGFHFYNPPPVQKLVETISTENTEEELKEYAIELGRRLGKILVSSCDIAGFIGNGHFMRDMLHALDKVAMLATMYGEAAALYIMERVSRDFLIRPMGIFQLADYVGLDVCRNILLIMDTYIEGEELRSPLLNSLLEQHIRGGQNPDGSQRDGILKYQDKEIVAIYDLNKSNYVSCTDLASELDSIIGPLPASHQSWKDFLTDEDKEDNLEAYFDDLNKSRGLGGELAREYLHASYSIALGLVRKGVASKVGDVNTVLQRGFYHLYGAIRPAEIT